MASNQKAMHQLQFSEWQRLSRAAQHVMTVPLGSTANFLVRTLGEAAEQNGVVFIRAECLSGTSADCPTMRILLKLPSADWSMVRHSSKPLKILQAVTAKDPLWHDLVLDCTGLDSVVVAQIETECTESLVVAELFAGGFQGFSQAAWALHRAGLPISVKWGVEKAPDCLQHQKAMEPDLIELRSKSDIHAFTDCNSPIMIIGDVCDNWWINVWNRLPVNTLAVTAPCQPWSLAGRESGLNSPVGRLLLRTLDVASSLQVRFVIIEQVAGFGVHPHYSFVIDCWRASGFLISWKATLDLIEVLPCQRSRIVLVLYHASFQQAALPVPFQWKSSNPGSLLSTQSLLDLPPDMLKQCLPSPETLSLYLNPALIPRLRQSGPGHQPSVYRIKQGHQTAGCFLAQYSFAHNLPVDLLTGKGLFGSLVQTQGQVRFFSCAEICSLHGATRTMLCPADKRQGMRISGNAISVPHAAAALVQCCHTAGIALNFTTEAAVQCCLQERLHNGNAIFLPCGKDWLLCSTRDAALYLSIAPQPALSPPGIADLFRTVTLCTPTTQYELRVAHQVSISDLLSGLQLEATIPQVALQDDTGSSDLLLQIPFRPCIPEGGVQPDQDAHQCIAVLCTAPEIFILHHKSSLAFVQIAAVAVEHAVQPHQPLRLCRSAGLLSQPGPRLPPFSLLLPDSPAPDIFDPSLLHVVGRGCHVQVTQYCVRLTVPATQAFQAWAGLPTALFQAVGWHTNFEPNPPGDGDALLITWTPFPWRVATSAEALLRLLRKVLLVARLQTITVDQHTADHVPVSVRVVADTVCQGLLPGTFLVDRFLSWWDELKLGQPLLTGCRILSGPHPLRQGLTCASVMSGSAGPRHQLRTGHLLLNVHPGSWGGGVKEENKQWCMARLATLALSQGAELQTVTPFVDQLVQAAGVPKLSAMLQSPTDTQQWEAVTDCARSKDIPVPALTDKRAKADVRVKRQAQRTRQQQRQVKAADICLEPGFFVNADNTPTVILDGITPGCSGLLVTDREHSEDILGALTGVQPDEMAIVILGHGCAPGTPGCQPLSFPASIGQPPAKVLVAGCLHNLGGKQVTCKHATQADVQVNDNVCCQFCVYKDEFEAAVWTQMAGAPVRTIGDFFRQGGHQKPFHAPWGRVYSCDGRPSTPQLADCISFHARIEQAEVDSVLRLTGHNHVYAVPKTWGRQPHPDFAIIWLGVCRSEALRASIQLPEQRGIARNKDRFGIRVCAAAHAKIFKQLHPDKEVPDRMPTPLLFRVGPFPPEAGPEDIRLWSQKCGWQTKVIKALGVSHWLLGAQLPPATDYLAFNGHAVLAAPVQNRASAQPILQSGTLPKNNDAATSSAPVDEDPCLHSDPWKAYKKSAPNGPTASRASASHALPARHVSGPTESRFQEQEARISAIEQGLQDLKTSSEQRHSEYKQAREEDNRSHKAESFMDNCRPSRQNLLPN